MTHYASWAEPVKLAADNLFPTFLNNLSFPAVAAIGLVKGDLMTTFGYAKTGTPLPTGNSIFMISSLQKLPGGILLGHLIDQHVVTLNEPVAHLLPSSVKPPTYDGTPMTLCQLADFTSGLPRSNTQLADAVEKCTTSEQVNTLLDQYLETCTLLSKPGTSYLYSNISAPMIPNLLARKLNRPYASLLDDLILKPLKMTSTGSGFTTSPSTLIRGYNSSTGHILRDPTDNAFALTGGPQMHSSIDDMTSFLRACIGASDSLSQNLLSQNLLSQNSLNNAIRIAQQPRFTCPNPTIQSAFFWTVRDGHIYFKDGLSNYYGYATVMIYDITAKCGIVILSNTTSGDTIDDCGWDLLNVLRTIQ